MAQPINPSTMLPYEAQPPTKQVIDRVEFTRRQYEWLESQFMEKFTNATATEAELRHNAGQRSVILQIKDRIQK